MPSHNHHFQARPFSPATLRGLNDNPPAVSCLHLDSSIKGIRGLTLQHNFALVMRSYRDEIKISICIARRNISAHPFIDINCLEELTSLLIRSLFPLKQLLNYLIFTQVSMQNRFLRWSYRIIDRKLHCAARSKAIYKPSLLSL